MYIKRKPAERVKRSMSKRGELQGYRQVKGKIKDNGDAESRLRLERDGRASIFQAGVH